MSCGRTWEVEAVIDGRLHGTELASFERHLAGCAECGIEQRKLDALHGALLVLPAPPPTELDEQRLRAQVLRSANERLLAPRAPRLPWIAAACIVAVLGVFAVSRTSRNALDGGARPEPPRQATLHDELPATTAIELTPPVVDQPTASTSPPLRRTPAAETFEHGVASFRAGNFGLADEQLATFERAAPGDPRCEDAAYLRAVARWRMGDRETATRLGRDYLRAHPAGLRRVDATRIVDGTAQ